MSYHVKKRHNMAMKESVWDQIYEDNLFFNILSGRDVVTALHVVKAGVDAGLHHPVRPCHDPRGEARLSDLWIARPLGAEQYLPAYLPGKCYRVTGLQGYTDSDSCSRL